MNFIISPVPAQRLQAMRSDDLDDAGERFEPFVVGDDGAMLRCCLRNARSGERIALIAYRPEGTVGAYREIGPIFTHADPCGGYAGRGAYPPAFRDRRQVFRAYDEAGRITDAIMVDGSDAETGIGQLLTRRDVATVHSRNVLYGCYMFAIDRC